MLVSMVSLLGPLSSLILPCLEGPWFLPVLLQCYEEHMWKSIFTPKILCLQVARLVPTKFTLYKLSPKAIAEMPAWIFHVWDFSFATIFKVCLFIHFVCLCVAGKDTHVPWYLCGLRIICRSWFSSSTTWVLRIIRQNTKPSHVF